MKTFLGFKILILDCGPLTKTTDKIEFKDAVDGLKIGGGGDCPEVTYCGIQLAAKASEPNSYIYVIAGANGKDDTHIYEDVMDLLKKKNLRVRNFKPSLF